MSKIIDTDLCVIGGGSGGLSIAAGAAQMGARTVLFEGHRMGGDCLNYGCVPSKAMLAAGKAAQQMRQAHKFGIKSVEPEVDFAAVQAHIQDVIAQIAPMDSVERFTGLGVHVIQEQARFTGPYEVTGGDHIVRARRFVIATGSVPFIPPIPGLSEIPYFTNETVFANTERPDHLLVIGGGPIGCELAQAHRNLGSSVSLFEMARLLPNDDREAAEIVHNQLVADGIVIFEGASITQVGKNSNGSLFIEYNHHDQTKRIEGSHLLIAVGRRPNLAGLGLEAAGIAYTVRGIKVDARLRTRNRKVFAVGDVAGGYQFTHVASYHASIIIKNVLFRLPTKVDYRAVPWVTYTEPELAQVGLAEIKARQTLKQISILRWPFHENDRAVAERDKDGFVKIIVDKRGRIVGVTIVGNKAGELLHPWIIAVQNRLKIGTMASFMAPYPTRGEAGKRAAGCFYTPKLFSERIRSIVRFLLKFS